MQFNQQPIEKRVTDSGYLLDVHSVFYTIQGEGPFSGTPCVFVRLAGCNLQCPLCDTDYTVGRTTRTPWEILESARDFLKVKDVGEPHRPPGLVVITGGEPFRQALGPLLQLLTAAGFYVQIETNGTLPPPDNHLLYNTDTSQRAGVYVVCSPKAGRVNPAIWGVACCAKYVMSADSIASDGLPIRALDHTVNVVVARPPKHWRRPIYLQPVDVEDEAENQRHTAAVRDSCLQHGYTLQLQLHKLIGVA
jgi:7-carboxy-7-deazaguanine synthase